MATCLQVVSLLLCASVVQVSCSLPLNIVVFLPHDDNTLLNTQELMRSVFEAVKDINNSSDLLKNVSIETTTILTQESDPYGALNMFLEQLSSNKKPVVIVGLLDTKLADIVLPIADQLGIVQIIDTPILLDKERSNLLTYTPLPSLSLHVETAVHLLIDLQWTRIGLLYTDDILYLRAAANFVSLVKYFQADIEIVQIPFNNASIKSTVNQLYDSELTAFVCLLPPVYSSRVVYEAEHRELNYAWILVDNSNSSLQLSTSNPNHTFIIRDNTNVGRVTPSGLLPYNAGLARQDFLYKSLWSVATALESLKRAQKTIDITAALDSLLQTFENLKHTQKMDIGLNQSIFVRKVIKLGTNLEFYSSLNKLLGYFDSQTKHLVRFVEPVYQIFLPSLKWLTVSINIVCIVFTTVILFLHLLFRNEPEVKASSSWLSLCVLMGCYAILTGAMIHFVNSGAVIQTRGERIVACSVSTGILLLGFDMIIATLLFKVLRIWRIFTIQGRTGKGWKDYSLLGYIGIIVLVKFVLLVIWTGVDPYILVDRDVTGADGAPEVIQQCTSNYATVWLFFIISYTVVLGLLLVGVSFKTRKIKQENFKDTKKMSIYVSSMIYLVILCISLWVILRVIGSSVASKVVIGMTYCLAVVLTELFLFLPKILPPLFRHLHIGFSGKTMDMIRSITGRSNSPVAQTV